MVLLYFDSLIHFLIFEIIFTSCETSRPLLSHFITLYLLSKLFSGNSRHIETMATEFIKLDNTILYVIKKIKNQHQRADIERIFDEVTKTIDFQHITKDSLNDSKSTSTV